MSTISQPVTFEDLYNDLQNRAREQTGIAATENQAKRYINIALVDMHIGQGESYPWAERKAELVTQPQYTTGTLSVNRGDTALTGSGTSWNTANEYGKNNMRAGGKITIDSSTEVYEIASVSSDTAAVLTSDFIGANQTGSITAFASGSNTTVTSAAHGLSDSMTVTITGTSAYDGAHTISSVTTDTFDITTAFDTDEATGTWTTGSVNGASYVYFEDEYTLAQDFLRPIDQQKFDEGISIDLVGRTEFRRRYPRNHIPGKPKIGTMLDKPFAAAATGSITAYSEVVSGETTCATSDTSSLEDGDTLVISGTTNYDGEYQITSITANTSFIIQKTFVADDGTGTWTRTTERVRHLRLAPPPNTSEMLRYHYVTSFLAVTRDGFEQTGLEADTDEPIVPLRYRHAIIFHALSHWYRDKKDDARSQEAAAEYTRIMLRITADNEIGSAKPQFRPRIGPYRRRARRPWRGGTGRYDLNGKFDRLEW